MDIATIGIYVAIFGVGILVGAVIGNYTAHDDNEPETRKREATAWDEGYAHGGADIIRNQITHTHGHTPNPHTGETHDR